MKNGFPEDCFPILKPPAYVCGARLVRMCIHSEGWDLFFFLSPAGSLSPPYKFELGEDVARRNDSRFFCFPAKKIYCDRYFHRALVTSLFNDSKRVLRVIGFRSALDNRIIDTRSNNAPPTHPTPQPLLLVNGLAPLSIISSFAFRSFFARTWILLDE